MAIDLSRAFDTVDHELLLREVSELPLNNKIKRFLFSCLRGRQTFVEFKGAKSKHRKMRQGVPQEVVLSHPPPPPPPRAPACLAPQQSAPAGKPCMQSACAARPHNHAMHLCGCNSGGHDWVSHGCLPPS